MRQPPFTMARRLLSGVLAICALSAGLITGVSPRFYDDDPIQREPETQDASRARPWNIGPTLDVGRLLFADPNSLDSVRAQNLNTIDEVPDSGWFTNRIHSRPVSAEELSRGPNTMTGPAPGGWTVIGLRPFGAAPGFAVRDERGDVWFLTFDSKETPNATTGAIAVASRLLWALGYFLADSHLSTITTDRLSVADTAIMPTQGGHSRQMTMGDVTRILERAARGDSGVYRVLAARVMPGRPLGGFRYEDTRPDDPNDIVPHEHRRELRALKVFGAWMNLVDVKPANTLDRLVEQEGRQVVRHYLHDVSSAFGTGPVGPHDWDEGWEHVIELDPLWKRLVSLNFYLRPWQRAEYGQAREIGRFEGDTFNPDRWRPRVSPAAILYARADDTFWAALRTAAFTDDMIRAAAETARYDDPAATRLLADVLIKRRDAILRTYLPRITPLIKFTLSDAGVLTFENAAVRYGLASSPGSGYRATWSRFDNPTGQYTELRSGDRSRTERFTAPATLPSAHGDFIHVGVSAIDSVHPAWASPVQVYFKKVGIHWKLVGLERMP